MWAGTVAGWNGCGLEWLWAGTVVGWNGCWLGRSLGQLRFKQGTVHWVQSVWAEESGRRSGGDPVAAHANQQVSM